MSPRTLYTLIVLACAVLLIGYQYSIQDLSENFAQIDYEHRNLASSQLSDFSTAFSADNTHLSAADSVPNRLRQHGGQAKNRAECNRLSFDMLNEKDFAKIVELKSEWHHLIDVAEKDGTALSALSKSTKQTNEMELHDVRRFMGPLGPFCKENLKVFGVGDEEKRACLHDMRSMDVNSPSRKCVVYSIGGNNEWTFEENIYGGLSALICQSMTIALMI